MSSKLIEELQKNEIFDSEWTKKIKFLGIALNLIPTQEFGIILLKSHDNIYAIEINSEREDLEFDAYIKNTNVNFFTYKNINDFKKDFSRNTFDYFLPHSNVSNEIIIHEKDGWLNFKFIEALLDNETPEIYSSIININADLLQNVDFEYFVSSIIDEFKLDQILTSTSKDKTITIENNKEAR